MKTVLVTGATGFIGNYVVSELLHNKVKVIATSVNEQRAKAASWFTSVKYIAFNLEEFDSTVNYFDYFGKPDAMIHLAWEGLPNYNSAFHLEKNLPRHYSFLSSCIRQGLTDITITGTCLEYGMQEGCLSEEMKTAPANPYALAKDKLRKQLEHLQGEMRFTLKWIRLFYMYGAGQNPNSLLSQLDKALTNKEAVFNMSGGKQERDYLPVEEVGVDIVKIAAQNQVTGVINCSSGRPVTVKAFVLDYLQRRKKYIELNLGYYPYTDYEPMHFWGDNSKLKTIINNEQSNSGVY